MLNEAVVVSYIEDRIEHHALSATTPELVVDTGDMTVRLLPVSGAAEFAAIDNDYAPTSAWAEVPETAIGISDGRYAVRKIGEDAAVVSLEWRTPPEEG